MNTSFILNGSITDRDTAREWSLSLSIYHGRASCDLLGGEGFFARVASMTTNFSLRRQ